MKTIKSLTTQIMDNVMLTENQLSTPAVVLIKQGEPTIIEMLDGGSKVILDFTKGKFDELNS